MILRLTDYMILAQLYFLNTTLRIRNTPSLPMAGGYKCRQVNVGLFVNLYGEVYDCNGLGRILAIGHIRVNSLEEYKDWEKVNGPDEVLLNGLRKRENPDLNLVKSFD